MVAAAVVAVMVMVPAARVQAYGVDLAVEICKRLLAEGTPGLHIYTLNTEKSALAILERLGVLDCQKPKAAAPAVEAEAAAAASDVTEGVAAVALA
jgi:hypothetical protein